MNTVFAESSIEIDLSHRHPWTREDDDLLLRRMGHADLVAIGTIRLVSHSSRYNAPRNMSLSFHPEEVLHGTAKNDMDREQLLTMHVSPSSSAFKTAQKIQDSKEKTSYLLLIKRKPLSKDRHQLRWVIYHPTRELLAKIKMLYKKLKERG